MIKAILFDIDNTLIDFMTMKQKSCETAVDAMISSGLKIEKEKAMQEVYQIYDKKGLEYQQVFQEFIKKVNGSIDYKILANGIIAYRKIKETYLVPYSNVHSTLIELSKKYKLGVISDAPRIQAWIRLVSMKIDPFFRVVITAADVRKQKTHFAPFKAALKQLKVKPEEALMVGDRIQRDIETAKKLGIRTCFAKYGETKPSPNGSSGADFEIKDIKEILKLKL